MHFESVFKTDLPSHFKSLYVIIPMMLVVYLTYTAMYVHHSMSSHRNLSSFNSSASFSLNGLKYALNCFLVEDDNNS